MKNIVIDIDIKKATKKEWFYPAIFFVLFYLTFIIVDLWPASDDMIYSEQLKTMGVFEWVKWRAETWQPRIICDFMLAVFNFNLPAWRFVTSFVCVFTFYVIGRIALKNEESSFNRGAVYLIVFSSYFLISPLILTPSVYWYTGSFNYLYQTLFMLIAIYPFYFNAVEGNTKGIKTDIIAIISACLASYSDVHYAIIICFGLYSFGMSLFAHKKRPRITLFVEFGTVVLNVLNYYRMGGNSIRMVEELDWYPEHEFLSFWDKITLGVNWTNNMLFHTGALLFFILTLSVLVLICFNRSSKLCKVCAAVTPFLLFVSILNPNNKREKMVDNHIWALFDSMRTAPPVDSGTGLANMIPSIICMIAVMLTGVMLVFAFKDIKKGITVSVLYLAALASSYVLGFSPTIFASGNRIFFTLCILFILVFGVVLSELIPRITQLNIKFTGCVCVIISALALFYLVERVIYTLHLTINY